MRHALLLTSLLTLVAGCYPDHWVDVSPDGSRMVFSGSRSSAGLWLLAPDGSRAEQLAKQASCPKLSPDGKQCVFTTSLPEGQEGKALAVYDFATKQTRVLHSWPEADGKKAPEAVLSQWRPDGRRIAYTVWTEHKDGDATADLFIFDPQANVDEASFRGTSLLCAWSPDGSRLAFFQNIDQREEVREGTLSRLVLVKQDLAADKKTVLVMTQPMAGLAWLSNDRLVFIAQKVSLPTAENSVDAGPAAVFLYDRSLGTVAPLVEHERMAPFVVQPSPDGRQILFAATAPTRLVQGDAPKHKGDGTGYQFWLYDIQTRRKHLVVDGLNYDHLTPPAWFTTGGEKCFACLGPNDTILTVRADNEGLPTTTRTVNLQPLLAPPTPEPQVAPPANLPPQGNRATKGDDTTKADSAKEPAAPQPNPVTPPGKYLFRNGQWVHEESK